MKYKKINSVKFLLFLFIIGTGAISVESFAQQKGAELANPYKKESQTPAFGEHPGGLQTQDAMSIVRSKVASNTQPWSTAWAAIKNTDAGNGYVSTDLTAVLNNKGLLQSQGHAAYVLAIKWVASGDITYANAAKNVINNWVNTVDTLVFTEAPLRVGIGAVQMANAAEILAHAFDSSAGWDTAQVKAAKAWFKKVVWPKIGTGGARSSNHGTSALAGCMAVAIFCDDANMFDYAVNAFKDGFPDAFRANGTSDGCAGLSQYISESSGQTVEAGRDQAHPQGGVGHLVEVALMAWNQGTKNLVTYSNNRLIAGVEYLAKYNLGDSVPYNANFADPCNVHPAWPIISPANRGSFSPIYEMCGKLFTLIGIPHPYTSQVINFPEYTPERTNSDHAGMGTLLYHY